MKKNIGTMDRGIRIVLAVAIAVLFLAGQLTGIAAIVLGILSIGFLATGVLSFCPLYIPLKISTIKK